MTAAFFATCLVLCGVALGPLLAGLCHRTGAFGGIAPIRLDPPGRGRDLRPRPNAGCHVIASKAIPAPDGNVVQAAEKFTQRPVGKMWVTQIAK
jgi:hypothetical protein